MRWSSAPARPIPSTTKPVGASLKAASEVVSTRGQSRRIVGGAGSVIGAPSRGGAGEGRTRLRIEEVKGVRRHREPDALARPGDEVARRAQGDVAAAFESGG